MGSSANLKNNTEASCHLWAHVGVDSNIEAQVWANSKTTQEVYLVGYATGTCTVYFTDPLDRTPAIKNEWQTVDLSADCPGAVGILALQMRLITDKWAGVRMHGSTDDITHALAIYWIVIGCDDQQRIDFESGGDATNYAQLFIWGYIKDDATFNVNAIDKSLSDIDAYKKVNVGEGRLAFLLLHGPGDIALKRADEVTEIFRDLSYDHQWGIVGIDENGDFEGKIENAAMDFWYIGKATSPKKPGLPQAIIIP